MAQVIKLPIQQCSMMNAKVNGIWFVEKELTQAENKFSVRSNGSADDDMYYQVNNREALIFPLINGERAFGALYDALVAAKLSVEIVCWGFQPSLFLKRGNANPAFSEILQENYSFRLGELLAQKARENVRVKILCFSLPLGIQNLAGDDLVNMPGYLTSYAPKIVSTRINKEESLADVDVEWWEKYANSKVENLEFETHAADPYQDSEYIDATVTKDAIGITQRMVYFFTASNHQKTVLIDFDSNDEDIIPTGFVLGHNYLDSYWDNDQHLYNGDAIPNNIEAAGRGKNVATPLQDISCKVYGAPLILIKKNFDQLWKVIRPDAEISSDIGDEKAAKLIEPLQKCNIPMQLPVPGGQVKGHHLYAQILRTYRREEIKDIARMYIKNIRHATKFIYTENQYFRFPPLVEALKEQLKYRSEQWPQETEGNFLYWFALTNSSDTGIGSGTKNTDRMFEALGKRHQMPEVARDRGWQPDFKEDDLQKAKELSEEQKALELREKRHKARNPKLMNESAQAEYNREGQAIQEKKAELDARYKELYANYDVSEEFANEFRLKSIICTLVAADASRTSSENAATPALPWQETYIHSKCTIIDDTMAVLGSANLNTRSMEVDTEIAILTECIEYATDLRQQLWKIHLCDNPEAQYQSGSDLETVFNEWGSIVKNNNDNEEKGTQPESRIREFFRANTKVSSLD